MQSNKYYYSVSLAFIVTVLVGCLAAPYAKASDLLLGGWSNHHTDSNEDYNEKHDTVGVVFDNGLTLATFRNSYNDRANLFGYTHIVKKWKYARIALTGGLVTGYRPDPMPYVLPTLSIGAGRVWLDTGLAPTLGGFVITHNLRITF
jgi:hypothetical protein